VRGYQAGILVRLLLSKYLRIPCGTLATIETVGTIENAGEFYFKVRLLNPPKALVRGPSQIAASICGYRISGKFESVLKEEVEQILAACRRTRPRCGEIRTSCDSLMTYRVVFGTQFHFVFLRSTFSVDNSVDSSFIRSY